MGFVCIVACALNKSAMSAQNMEDLAISAQETQERVLQFCATIPYGSVDFSEETSWNHLYVAMFPWADKSC